jgi:hypothetical protein
MPSASAAALTTPAPDTATPPRFAGVSTVVELQPNGRQPFELLLEIQPVWSLRSGGLLAYRLAREGLPPDAGAAELEEADAATLALADALMDEAGDEPARFQAPLSFSSLSSQRTRQRLMTQTQAIRERMRDSVVIEIDGLHAGVPPSRMTEVIGLVRSLCAGVVGRTRPNRAALAAVAGCGFNGLVVDGALLSLRKPDPAKRLRAFVVAAGDISADLFVHGLPHAGLMGLAAEAGFAGASIAATAG